MSSVRDPSTRRFLPYLEDVCTTITSRRTVPTFRLHCTQCSRCWVSSKQHARVCLSALRTVTCVAMDAKLGGRLTMYQTLLYSCLVCVVSLTGGVVDASMLLFVGTRRHWQTPGGHNVRTIFVEQMHARTPGWSSWRERRRVSTMPVRPTTTQWCIHVDRWYVDATYSRRE